LAREPAPEPGEVALGLVAERLEGGRAGDVRLLDEVGRRRKQPVFLEDGLDMCCHFSGSCRDSGNAARNWRARGLLAQIKAPMSRFVKLDAGWPDTAERGCAPHHVFYAG